MSLCTVSWKYALLMSPCFTSNDKLADILTETSTLLVESTDSSMEDVCATRPCLALEQSHKHSECTPSISSCSSVERNRIYSCFIDLLCELHSMGPVLPRAFAPLQARDQHQIFSKISIVVIPRILLALSRFGPNQVRFLGLSL